MASRQVLIQRVSVLDITCSPPVYVIILDVKLLFQDLGCTAEPYMWLEPLDSLSWWFGTRNSSKISWFWVELFGDIHPPKKNIQAGKSSNCSIGNNINLHSWLIKKKIHLFKKVVRSQCEGGEEFSSLARLLNPLPFSAHNESQPITHPSSCSIDFRRVFAWTPTKLQARDRLVSQEGIWL